ncbi:OmpA/MotB family protein [Mucilaginibacter boryungensis]|uniref:OmpA family protein n=1 Tax=Mucilaginibacter boryungensis TaxID=768480 RepID=A0ABR9XJD3_9SPHI|nr:OmpA family protein [Mucilaginibacter boryungensis]MBE9667484.1 OmpA family protein [Mucilaginibacter boryungensis]
MKIKYLLFALIVGVVLQSCVVMSPKKYKALLAERDSLSSRTLSLEGERTRLQSDTARLHHEIAELKKNYNDLNENYNVANKNLGELNNKLNSTSSRVSQLSGDLAKREARLKEVEDILRKRDEATNALKEKLQKALLGFTQNGLSVDIRNGKVYVSLTDKLLFPSGSIVIDEKGKQALKQLAAVLNKEPDINMAVEGHTDNKKVKNLGQIKDNWDLSVLRATSVTRYLTEEEKIDPKRLTATGKSEYQPIDNGNTPEALAKNRRIEIVLSPKLDELYNLITK